MNYQKRNCFGYNVTKKRLNSKDFKIAQLHIRSMVKNIDEFRMYALNHQYEIICVSETWLDNTVDNNHELDGYDLLRKDKNRHGGVVVKLIRSTINYKIRSDTITVAITKPFLLNTWYRPPDMPVDVFTDYELRNILVQKMDCENKEIICIGDFTCDWLSPEKSETKKLSDFANMFQLEQFVKEPTRITSAVKLER